MTDTHRLAAIDIGTVTTRLLVADVGENSITIVGRSTDITHLGEGLSATGVMTVDAMTRVADVISGYARTMDDLRVQAYHAVATSASRDAENASEFVAMLAGRGIEPHVIDGAHEAELAFRGATAERDGESILVVDCGGGSTELVVGDARDLGGEREVKISSARSIDVGSRRMTERFLHSDPPTRGELEEARGWAASELRPFFERLAARPSEVVGLAGTATTLAAIKLELATYDPAAVHGYELSGSDLSDILLMLASMPLEKRISVVGLHPERAGVIVAGSLILETVLALAGADSLVVSEHDILYGILMETYRDLREQSR